MPLTPAVLKLWDCSLVPGTALEVLVRTHILSPGLRVFL